MTSKDSVKNRLETGISYTEFTYQLIQGYDFYWLWKNKDVKIQLGGSDQWGNILTGTELIRKIGKDDSYALTTPLITKTDGGKFGKTEDGNVWLDEKKTSPYKFYQFWINVSDDDAINFIKIFSLESKNKIEKLIGLHTKDPHLRILQKFLADEITILVHGKSNLEVAKKTSKILFGKSEYEDLIKMNEIELESLSSAVPCVTIKRSNLSNSLTSILSEDSKNQIFKSKSDVRRMINNNGLSINKKKIIDEKYNLSENLLLNKFILLQKGKKHYTFIIVE